MLCNVQEDKNHDNTEDTENSAFRNLQAQHSL